MDIDALSPEEQQALVARALRDWTVMLSDLFGPQEATNCLFAEALSAAQAHLTPGQIAGLLRQMAGRIEDGELSPRMN